MLYEVITGNIHKDDSRYRQSHLFIGVVADDSDLLGHLVEGRNRFAVGEELELIGPGMRQATFRLEAAYDLEGGELKVVQPNALVRLKLPAGAKPGDLLRKVRPA